MRSAGHRAWRAGGVPLLGSLPGAVTTLRGGLGQLAHGAEGCLGPGRTAIRTGAVTIRLTQKLRAHHWKCLRKQFTSIRKILLPKYTTLC